MFTPDQRDLISELDKVYSRFEIVLKHTWFQPDNIPSLPEMYLAVEGYDLGILFSRDTEKSLDLIAKRVEVAKNERIQSNRTN
jgi:hypothetical protein